MTLPPPLRHTKTQIMFKKNYFYLGGTSFTKRQVNMSYVEAELTKISGAYKWT